MASPGSLLRPACGRRERSVNIAASRCCHCEQSEAIQVPGATVGQEHGRTIPFSVLYNRPRERENGCAEAEQDKGMEVGAPQPARGNAEGYYPRQRIGAS